MKRKKITASLIVIFATCGIVFGQDFKPLKSFDNDEVEYLKYNFDKGKNQFKGYSFGDIMKAAEVKFQAARINCTRDSSSLFMYLYLQSPEFVNDRTLKKKHFTGLKIYFEEDNDLKEATRIIMALFPRNSIGPIMLSLTNENMDKLIDLLSKCKIGLTAYYDDIEISVVFG